MHDPYKSHEFLGNLGTIQWIHFAISQECLQNPRKSVICSASMLKVPGNLHKILGNLSFGLPKYQKFPGNLCIIHLNPIISQEIWEPSNGYTLQHHKNAYKILGILSFVLPEILKIPRKFVHNPSKSYKFPGNLGTIQWIRFATSQECLQKPKKAVICSVIPTRIYSI